MRLLMMFGPMIFRQFQKHQRNKQASAPPPMPQRGRHLPEKEQGDYIKHRKVSEAELAAQKNSKLSEDDIMLDKEDLRHLENNKAESQSRHLASDAMPDKKDIKDSKLDLEEWFLDGDKPS